ncbi:nucleotide exchange factor GrpE [Kaistia dalseonensis]|uniref:Protein GrpE n=1 Tax=Kaistia dalseonensis TaxID=410840 RepID=A0ABU0H6D9_9HYPH|nr:nucleotide exchange factor GrpE [Kaistia dalseonensis]MCX5494862.1 nucleotide exchange factor GrpE [Kaistia dalseonensis]MDQ0437443.1 molecular chaperone GrpE [Kaistia dalseonensis]
MSNDTQSTPGSETPAEAQSAAAAGEAAGGAEARIAALEAETTELKDRVLRTMAEMENLRRRTEREVADARQYAIAAFARDMLTAGDNLARTIEAVPEGARAGNEALTALIDGVEMTERDLQKSLEKHGVRKLDPVGQKFDPNLHQAIFEVPTEEKPAGTVMQVMQSGYVIGERVLRPAMVGVAKGAPKPKPTAKPETESTDGSAS